MSYSIRCGCWRCENIPPTVFHLYGISQEKATQIGELDAEVGRTQHDTINALLEQCAALNRKRNALLPAVNLPFEILAMIFEIACIPSDNGNKGPFSTVIGADFWQNPGSEYWTSTHSLAFIPGPLFIAQVCSSWRQVAHSTPQLWNSIKIYVDNKHAEQQASILEYWLSHSDQLPFAVALVEFRLENTIDSMLQLYDMPTTVIDTLAPYAHRLHTAELLMTDNWEPALIHIGQCASLLTSLTLVVPDESHSIRRVNFFAETPLLRDVTVFGYNIMDDVVLPLPQIERLFNEIVVETFNPVEALRMCPKLRHCTFETQTYDTHFDLSTPRPLLHGTLQSLNLIIATTNELEGLLDLLALPMLRTFEVDLGDLYPPIFSIQSTLFARSVCALEKLHLTGVIIPEDDLIEFLQMLPGLRDLHLTLCQDWTNKVYYSKFLDLMCPRKISRGSQGGEGIGLGVDEKGNEQCLLPNLEIFHFTGYITLDSHALLEFLSGRWGNQQNTDGLTDQQVPLKQNTSVARLRSARFDQIFHLEDDDIVILRRLRREGMHVDIRDY